VKTIVFIFAFIVAGSVGFAQEQKGMKLPGTKINGDTILYREIPPVFVYPRTGHKSKRFERRYWRLVQKVKKVYPYAKKANELLHEYSAKYEATQDKKLRRQYVREAEKRLFQQYGPQLKKLSVSEGRILIKLIDRETGTTSYQLIQDLKGNLSAFFWQGVARVFGNNLKAEYDPVTEDRLIEEIIFYIDAGIIK